MSVPWIKGIFLSGGQSQRMGEDKGLLCYRGRGTEIERWKGIFDELGVPFHWSLRPEQYPDRLFPHIPRLVDQTPGSGPLGALVTAYHLDPKAAWLVLACDWPLLERADLAHLLRLRRPEFPVTVAVHQNRRQPLFAIYEPDFLVRADMAWRHGERSLDRLLHGSAAMEISDWDPQKLLNANDPAARRLVEATLRHPASPSPPHQNAH